MRIEEEEDKEEKEVEREIAMKRENTARHQCTCSDLAFNLLPYVLANIDCLQYIPPPTYRHM